MSLTGGLAHEDIHDTYSIADVYAAVLVGVGILLNKRFRLFANEVVHDAHRVADVNAAVTVDVAEPDFYNGLEVFPVGGCPVGCLAVGWHIECGVCP